MQILRSKSQHGTFYLTILDAITIITLQRYVLYFTIPLCLRFLYRFLIAPPTLKISVLGHTESDDFLWPCSNIEFITLDNFGWYFCSKCIPLLLNMSRMCSMTSVGKYPHHKFSCSPFLSVVVYRTMDMDYICGEGLPSPPQALYFLLKYLIQRLYWVQ